MTEGVKHALMRAACLLLLSGCTLRQTEILDVEAADSCVYANDGVCDEPHNCAFGSDSSDCDRACATAYEPAIAAACHADEQPVDPPPPDVGSGGQGGPGGLWEGSIQARSPNDPNVTITRYYRVYVPPKYDPERPSPLLYVMGGFRVDNHSLASYTELSRLADQKGIILVYLQAHFLDYGPSGWVFQWYVYPNNWSPSDWPSNPDVDFVRRLSSELKGLYNIDRTRIFTSGHSRGGAESIIMAFEAPDLIAGFLSQSGFTGANGYQSRIRELSPARKVTGVIVHGVADTDVPIAEGDGTHQALIDAGHVPGEDFVYFRLEGVTHQWQPQYNAQAWAFMNARPLPLTMVTP